MHASCYEWVRGVVTSNGLSPLATLEVGSLNVNGSVRDFFTGPYLGVDIEEGPGVDRICDAEHLYLLQEKFPVVVSTEMLEHVKRPWLVLDQIYETTEIGGYVIITARGFDERGCWELHEHPIDVYRYSDHAMRALAESAGLEVLELMRDPEGPGWFLLATRQ